MKLINIKDWKTTLLGIIGGIVVLAGMLWPDRVDQETGAQVTAAASQVVLGIGALIALITGILAKDK
jgi:predicted ATP-grasp superfamily ATP-dependent carboligase